MDYSNIEDRMEKAVGAYERNLIVGADASVSTKNKIISNDPTYQIFQSQHPTP